MPRAAAKTPRTRTKPPQVTPVDPAALHPGNGADNWRQPVGDVADEDGAIIVQPFDPPEETAADRVAVLMRSAGNVDRATVKLYKVLDPATKKLGSCRDYTPEEFEAGGVPMIRKHWGPGEYLAYLYGEVDGQYSRRGVMPLTVLEDRSANPSAEGGIQSDALGRVLETIANGQQAMLQALTNRPDPAAQLRDTLSLMTMMRDALGTPKDTPTITGVLADLRAMQKASQEFAKPGKTDDEPSWMKVLPGVVDMLAQRLGGVPSANANPGVIPAVTLPPSLAQPSADQVAPAGEAVPDAEAIETTPVPVDDGTELLQMYQALMFYYNGLAKRGADPEAAAITLYDQLPDEALPMLRGDDWWDRFCAFSPGSKPYREWYTKLRDHILALEKGEAEAP